VRLAGFYADNIGRWQTNPAIDWDRVGAPLLAMLAAVRHPPIHLAWQHCEQLLMR
jgi:hypothetical protein